MIVALADEALIIEAGWLAYRARVLPANASQVQIDETRKGFFAGAHHLFTSIFAILEPEAEVSDNDLRRLDNINNELDRFYAQLLESIGGGS